jgi:hypothetical protein
MSEASPVSQAAAALGAARQHRKPIPQISQTFGIQTLAGSSSRQGGASWAKKSGSPPGRYSSNWAWTNPTSASCLTTWNT